MHALDNLRAVAMFLGIVLHGALSFMVTPIPWPARDTEGHWSFDVMVGFIHGFRMQAFFLLAGFFARLLYERLGAAEFAKHRLKRIGVPFVAGMFTLIPLIGALWAWGVWQMDESIGLPIETRRGLDAIPTGHLWFLQYLLVLYACAFLVVRMTSRLPAGVLSALDGAFDRLMQSPLRALPFVPFTVACLWGSPVWGEIKDVGLGFVPRFEGVAYYGLFFGAGWWLHRRRSQLDQLTRFLKRSVTIAVAAMIVHGAILATQPEPSDPNHTVLKLTSLGCVSLYAWLMTFAVTGCFLRFAGRQRRWMRYLADASYWCYLTHLPVVIYLQIIVAGWPFNGWVKFTLLIALATLVLLASYQVCVRYTFIGSILNGPRQRPAKPPQLAPAPAG